MRRGVLVVVVVLAYSVLYAPQPLLPLLSEQYGVSLSTAALLITATLLPLSVAPLSYGYLLQSWPATRVLRVAVLALGVSELAFALADSFAWLLGVRLLQGLLLPAVFTAAMTHSALAAAPGRVQRAMSVYIAASIGGGYLGRLLAGVGAEVAGWRAIFFVLAAGLLLSGGLMGGGGARVGGVATTPPSPRLVAGVLRSRTHARLYALIFCSFFVFAALLNFLPFRLQEVSGRVSTAFTGLIYTGYLLGVATSLGSSRIALWMGGARRALLAGLAVFTATLLLALVPRLDVLFVAMLGFCGAMFLMHATAAGLVNREAGERAGIVNGLYLVFYYLGGVLGSYLPGLVYERHGWGAFVTVLLGVVAVAWLVARLALDPAEEPGTGQVEGGGQEAPDRGAPATGGTSDTVISGPA